MSSSSSRSNSSSSSSSIELALDYSNVSGPRFPAVCLVPGPLASAPRHFRVARHAFAFITYYTIALLKQITTR
eukprot:10958682-Heterocapsa_arctica.AAC.1